MIGLAIALLGAALLILSFTAVAWLSADGSRSAKFSDLSTAANSGDTEGGNGLALAYFSWLGWLLLALAVLTAVVASLPSVVARITATAGVAIGMGAAVISFFAIKLGGGDLGDYVDLAGPGYWMAIAGFVLCGLAGPLGLVRS